MKQISSDNTDYFSPDTRTPEVQRLYNQLPPAADFKPLEDAILATETKTIVKPSSAYNLSGRYLKNWEDMARAKLHLAYPNAAPIQKEPPSNPVELAKDHSLLFSSVTTPTSLSYVQPPLTHDSILALHHQLSAPLPPLKVPPYREAKELHDKPNAFAVIREVLLDAQDMQNSSNGTDTAGNLILET